MAVYRAFEVEVIDVSIYLYVFIYIYIYLYVFVYSYVMVNIIIIVNVLNFLIGAIVAIILNALGVKRCTLFFIHIIRFNIINSMWIGCGSWKSNSDHLVDVQIMYAADDD